MKSDYTYHDITTAFKNIGVKDGDSVFLHSNLGFFGTLEDATTADQLNETFFNAIAEVVGNKGTIVVPTFSYSFCKNEEFDLKNTKGTCGMFSEYLRKVKSAKRSLDANFSVAAIGSLAEVYTCEAPEHSFGKNSFWERLTKQNGKILCLNFPYGSTFIHYVEKSLNVAYRYDKLFHGKLFIDGQFLKDATFIHYVRDLDRPDDESSCARLNEVYMEKGLLGNEKLGRGSILSYETQPLFDFLSDTLKTRPRFLLKNE